MRNGSLLHRIWWRWGDECWPGWLWVWRPYCWLRRRHENDSYDSCVFCGKALAAPADGRKGEP